MKEFRAAEWSSDPYAKQCERCDAVIGYRIKRSDYEDFLRRRTRTGAIAAHLLREASAAPDA